MTALGASAARSQQARPARDTRPAVAGARPGNFPNGAEILGLGDYQPSETAASAPIAERFGKTGEWVRARTGIESRRVAGAHESVLDMAVAAGADALKNADLPATDIDLVIVASCSVPDPRPGTAAQAAVQLGASAAAAFDLNSACAGFCYSLAVASDAVRAGSATRVLVIGAEKMTAWVDPSDLGTSIIFGDGAGAAVVGPAEAPGIGPVAWGSDGSRADVIHIRQDTEKMHMEGQAVFRWATGEMTAVAEDACRRAGVAPAQLDALVPHQANLRIVEALATRLRLDDAVVARDIVRSGNTSAASIPIALHRLRDDDAVQPGGLALLIGFGAGLTYAAQVVRIPE